MLVLIVHLDYWDIPSFLDYLLKLQAPGGEENLGT